jgi:hypothetical protein
VEAREGRGRVIDVAAVGVAGGIGAAVGRGNEGVAAGVSQAGAHAAEDVVCNAAFQRVGQPGQVTAAAEGAYGDQVYGLGAGGGNKQSGDRKESRDAGASAE